ncbi:MAG: hypothetical protein NWF00_00320 [Candidatus Bathyarchaeota archaeon]|nr:hypothetical protein [Candidatus Bathyarchaeota archaeon]
MSVLVSLLLVVTILVPSANFASAVVGAANFLPNNYQSTVDSHEELALSEDVAEYITGLLEDKYPDDTYHSYGESCTVGSYCSILSTLQSDCDQAVVFSKGHRGYPYYDDIPRNVNHLSLLDNDTNHVRDDEEILDNTSTENVVTFIWHCESTLNYTTGTIPSDAYGPYGMPYCWTHNQYMYQYDDAGSQVFLGWNNDVPGSPYPQQSGGSPQYDYAIDANFNYANVAGSFWYYACNSNTVIQALDSLCDDIYGDDFEYTDLHGWLIIWGNENLYLP